MKTHGRFFTTILALTLSFMAALPSPSPAQEVTRENVREIIKTPMTDSPLLVKMSHWRDSRPGQLRLFDRLHVHARSGERVAGRQ